MRSPSAFRTRFDSRVGGGSKASPVRGAHLPRPLTMPDSSWRVLGYDRFAREEYLIGEFPSRALAEAAAREAKRRHERTQDEPLRDDVWIVAPDPAADHP